MNNKKLQKIKIENDQLAKIKGGYKYVPNGEEAAGFVGSSVDIRLSGGKNEVFRSNNNPSNDLGLSLVLR